jgi:hypothetical protein
MMRKSEEAVGRGSRVIDGDDDDITVARSPVDKARILCVNSARVLAERGSATTLAALASE